MSALTKHSKAAVCAEPEPQPVVPPEEPSLLRGEATQPGQVQLSPQKSKPSKTMEEFTHSGSSANTTRRRKPLNTVTNNKTIGF